MKAMFAIALPIAVVAFAVFGVAHEGATGIVKQRMDGMESMSVAMKAIQRHLAARDFAAIQAEVGRLRIFAARVPSWFPPGGDAKSSDALPAVWQRWPDFAARAKQLQEEIEKLSSLTGAGDPKRITDQFRAVGQNCAGCHKLFRRP